MTAYGSEDWGGSLVYLVSFQKNNVMFAIERYAVIGSGFKYKLDNRAALSNRLAPLRLIH